MRIALRPLGQVMMGTHDTFSSVLFERQGETADAPVPDFFVDLNLDQIFDAITTGRAEYDLAPFFRHPLHDIESVLYRQDILRDLQDGSVRRCVQAFAEKMRISRSSELQASKLRERYQREWFVLDAVDSYCDATARLAEELAGVELTSRGMLGLRTYLSNYVQTSAFADMAQETHDVRRALADVVYSVHVSGFRVTVRRHDAEADYSREVQKTFERFEQGEVKDYRVTFREQIDMNHVEASILELVARLFPEEFGALDRHFAHYQAGCDEAVLRFDREVQFYLGYLEYCQRLSQAGLRFCFPAVVADSKEISARGTFDCALANKLVQLGNPVVCNDFALSGAERIFVVSGPNQGGKTTFARTFGQVHYLASLGLTVPGEQARLALSDQIYTHFEKEEELGDFTGKLEDDLVRAREIFTRATSASIIILNEIFTSTTLEDASFLGRKVIEKVTELDSLCVYVTFVDELASLSDATVSMVSTVVPEDPAERTYKVVRKPADGLSYAVAIARKYGLTYDRLKDRISS